MYKMNENIRIKVKTPVGITDAEDTGGGIAQGSVEACIESSVNLDKGVEEAFMDSDKELEYFKLTLGPVMFIDDLFRMAENIAAAQHGNDVLEDMVGRKTLEFNQSKSCFLLVGNKRARKLMENKLRTTPLTLNGQNMKKVKVLKYLGDSISHSSDESVHQTIVQRIGLIKHSIQELRAIVEDRRAQCLGGLNVAFTVWELSIVPTLLHNS